MFNIGLAGATFMIRTLLLSSMITFVGQAAAFPVLGYNDIQQELGKVRLDQDPLELLSLIETHLRHDLVILSCGERLSLVKQLEVIQQDVEKHCDRMYERFNGLWLPWCVTLGAFGWALYKFDTGTGDLGKRINAIIEDTYEEYYASLAPARNEAKVAFAHFFSSFVVTLLAHMQYNGQVNASFGGDYRALTNKINNIIALLKQ